MNRMKDSKTALFIFLIVFLLIIIITNGPIREGYKQELENLPNDFVEIPHDTERGYMGEHRFGSWEWSTVTGGSKHSLGFGIEDYGFIGGRLDIINLELYIGSSSINGPEDLEPVLKKYVKDQRAIELSKNLSEIINARFNSSDYVHYQLQDRNVEGNLMDIYYSSERNKGTSTISSTTRVTWRLDSNEFLSSKAKIYRTVLKTFSMSGGIVVLLIVAMVITATSIGFVNLVDKNKYISRKYPMYFYIVLIIVILILLWLIEVIREMTTIH